MPRQVVVRRPNRLGYRRNFGARRRRFDNRFDGRFTDHGYIRRDRTDSIELIQIGTRSYGDRYTDDGLRRRGIYRGGAWVVRDGGGVRRFTPRYLR